MQNLGLVLLVFAFVCAVLAACSMPNTGRWSLGWAAIAFCQAHGFVALGTLASDAQNRRIVTSDRHGVYPLPIWSENIGRYSEIKMKPITTAMTPKIMMGIQARVR